VKANPGLAYEGSAAMYGMIAHIPLRSMVRRNIMKMMEGMYGPKGEMPDLSGRGETANESSESHSDEINNEDFAVKAGTWFLKLRDRLKKGRG